MSTRAPTRPGRPQRGAALVEFALVCLLFLGLVLGIFEYGRWMYMMNAAQLVTQRAARAAAVGDFSDPAAMQALRRAALLRNDDGALGLAPELNTGSVQLDYLWQDAAGSLQPMAVLPACPAANRVNCLAAPHGSSCIRFVRARLCGAGGGCPPLPYQSWVPLVPMPATLPPASSLMRAEALGHTPGAAPCL